MSVFNDRQRAVLTAFAEAAFPAVPGLPGAAEAAIPPGAFDAMFATADPEVADLVKKAIFAFENATRIFDGTIRGFSRLPLERRIRVVARWEASRFYWRRMVCLLLKLATGMPYASTPAFERAVGYSSRCQHEDGAPR